MSGGSHIVVLPGDGIGPEVIEVGFDCLTALSDRHGLNLTFEYRDFGGVAIDLHGVPLPPATLVACQKADAILLGAVGGPKWFSAAQTPEDGLLAIRKGLGLFANLRPAAVTAGMEDRSPLRADIAAGADVLVVRELTGGLYFGDKTLGEDRATDTCAYTAHEVERIARVAFEAARQRRGKLTSVDKANVLATSKLWRKVVNAVAADYPDVELDHLYVDATAMKIVTNPRGFDVILTENLFGDILSDELSVIAGSIGLLGSASVGSDGPGLFEPIHGSAPDIAGQDKANPAGMLESAAMMLDRLGHAAPAAALRDAVAAVLASGIRTADLGGEAKCSEFGHAVRERLAERVAA